VYLGHHRVERLAWFDGESLPGGSSGSAHGRAVILATGVLDHYPHFRDWESYVGVSMFWCITCDGYESRGKKIVVAGHTNDAASEAMQMTRLSDDITLITNSHVHEIDDRFTARLAAAGIPVLHDKIHTAEGSDGQLETLETIGGLQLPVERCS
jgi:thioredoxin reductase (NADPH)